MIKKKGQPISGGRPQFQPTPNVLTESNQTSSDAQRLARASATPFQNRQGPANIPTGRLNTKTLGIPYDVPKPVNAKPQNYGAKVAPGTTPQMLSAVGEPRLPKGYNPIQSGYPTRGAQRVVGGGNTPSAKWGPKAPSAKQRSQYPGIFGRNR